MADNRDESPLIVGAPDAQGSPFSDRHLIGMLLCCDAAEEFSSWNDKLKGSVARGREFSGSLVNEAAACFRRQWRNLFKRLKKTSSMGIHSSNQSKSGRFQYDPFSYELNFDDGSVDEDEYSLRAFSARFACPIAKPREAEYPFI